MLRRLLPHSSTTSPPAILTISICAQKRIGQTKKKPQRRDTLENYELTRSNQVGTGKISVAEEVAQVQRVLRASGLKYTMHSAGTTVGAFILFFLFFSWSG